MTAQKQKKRRDPPKIEPVLLDGVRYEAPVTFEDMGNRYHGGVVTAIDDKTGRLLWVAQVYTQPKLDPSKEKDKQRVYISELSPRKGGSELKVANEAGETFRIRLADQDVRKLFLGMF